jgi:glycosyltransferase involved in cell wall biosynthesis
MKIAINCLSATIGGGVTYFSSLISQLNQQDKENDYYLFVAEEYYPIIFGDLKLNDNFRLIKIKKHNLLWRIVIEQVYLPILVHRYRIDVLFCPANILSFLAPCKKMLGILNINPYVELDIPGESPIFKMKMRILRALSSWSIKYADVILHQSGFSLELLQNKVGGEKEKNKIVYLGVSPFFAVDSRGLSERKGKYILSVSNISKRKNCSVLIKAYAKLPQQLWNEYQLVLVGEISAEMRAELDALVAAGPVRERIILRGKINLNEIPSVYKDAAIFVFPSLAESFGLPVVEAMAAGLPVIVADNTALPEIAGQAAIAFDPYQENDLAAKMVELLSDRQKYQLYVKRSLARAGDFSWEKTARETLKQLVVLGQGKR